MDQVDGDMTLDNFQSLAPTSGIGSFVVNWGQSLEITGDAFELSDTGLLNAWRDSNGNDQYDPGEEGIFDMMAGYDNG